MCGKTLVGNEHDLCTACLLELPEALSARSNDNFVERRLIGRIPIQHATALLIFRRKSSAQKIIHQIKYSGNERLAITMGRQMGLLLNESGLFSDIDCLVPVPLHKRKQRQRGYNQSQLLCEGIAQTFPHPIVSDNLIRTHHTESQTHKTRIQRLDNMNGVFAVKDKNALKNKHILLIDDVITTGATTEACWSALSSVEGLKISIAALAVSGDT